MPFQAWLLRAVLIADDGGHGVLLRCLLPTGAVTARRLHDSNRNGGWQLIAITVVGIIPLLIWLCSRGERTSNRYGSPV